MKNKHLVEEMQERIGKSKARAEYRTQEISSSSTASFRLYYFRTTEDIEVKKAYVQTRRTSP